MLPKLFFKKKQNADKLDDAMSRLELLLPPNPTQELEYKREKS
jgi:hypothetical protein